MRDERAAQRDVIGDAVHVTATFCPAADGDRCGAAGAVQDPGDGVSVQALAAFLVPDTAAVPATATAHLPAALTHGAATPLARRASLDEALELERPAPPGRRWAGYLSAAIALPDEPADAVGDWTVDADFAPGRGDGGLPEPASFAYAAVGGARLVRDGLPAGRPVDCAEATTSCGPTSPGGAVALRDLRGSGGTATAVPGETVSVPFTLRAAGPGGATFTLTAATALPGATASPTAATLATDGPAFLDAGVTVAVPAAARPGEYAVELAAAAGGDVRRATGRLVVSAPPAPEPDGDGGVRTIHLVIGAAQPPISAPPLEFRAFDRTTLSADGRSVNVGELACHRTAGACAGVAVQLSARWTELHDVASTARTSERMRLVVFGRAVLTVPARGRRAARVPVGPAVRHVLAEGRTVHVIAAVRATADAAPLVRRVALRGR